MTHKRPLERILSVSSHVSHSKPLTGILLMIGYYVIWATIRDTDPEFCLADTGR